MNLTNHHLSTIDDTARQQLFHAAVHDLLNYLSEEPELAKDIKRCQRRLRQHQQFTTQTKLSTPKLGFFTNYRLGSAIDTLRRSLKQLDPTNTTKRYDTYDGAVLRDIADEARNGILPHTDVIRTVCLVTKRDPLELVTTTLNGTNNPRLTRLVESYLNTRRQTTITDALKEAKHTLRNVDRTTPRR